MEDIIFITIAAVICGAETWNDIEQYGKSRQSRLSQYLRLPNGIPSHDTFNRFFSALDSDGFEGAFLSWIKDVSSLREGETASMDGKTIRGSLTSGSKRAVHTVSARASASQPGLGQVKVEEKSGEIPIVPKLLEVLALKGCTVTTDSTGCQRETAVEITGKEADNILAVKGNQGNSEENAEETVHFTKAAEEWAEEDFGHGRIESRKCSVYRDLSFTENASMWKELKGVVKIESTRYIQSTGKEESETRLYITGSETCAEVTGKGIRSHRGIENKLHRQLDVSFSEDQSRKGGCYAARNFSLLNT